MINDTVWLNLNQLAQIFARDKSVISRHLHNIFKERELDRNSTVALFATVQSEGGRDVERSVEYFNLDAIISVGYRVNSKRGTKFRIWATNVLRKHLIDGFTLNEKQLRQQAQNIGKLQEAVRLLGNVAALETVSDESRGIIRIIEEYSRALEILGDFDHERLAAPAGTQKAAYALTYAEAVHFIEQMRAQFQATPLMGKEKDKSFAGSLSAIYQTFDAKDVYPTVEEKAVGALALFHCQKSQLRRWE